MSLTAGKFSPQNRFGFHKKYLQEVSPNFADKEKAGCYIPTRREVHIMPVEELEPILIKWFTKAPEELMPTMDQKKTVTMLLRMRSDDDKVRLLAEKLENLSETA